MQQPIPCKRVADNLVVIRVSQRRYRIGFISSGQGFQFGFTNLREVHYPEGEKTLSHAEVLEWLHTHPKYTTPFEWTPTD